MNLEDYLFEVKMKGVSPKLESLFNEAIKEVFSSAYFNKIEKDLAKKIGMKKVKLKDNKVAAYTMGSTIYVNEPYFESISPKKQMDYLLHEFIHILQKSKKFFLLSSFKELNSLGIKLWKIVKKESKNPGKFLTNKDTPSHLINKYEVIAYLMNNSINWNEISSDGRRQFKNLLKSSGLFNLSSNFWKKRLP
jgi:hypothetical protein